MGEEGVDDATCFEEVLVASERARLLGLGLGSDPFFGGSNSSIDIAHEEISLGSSWRWRLLGTCEGGADCFNKERISVSDKWKSLDRQSAVTLCSPGTC